MSVLPIVIIVAILCLAIAPLDSSLFLAFLIGTVMIIVGMGLFTLGAETSMTVIGNRIGATLTKSKKLWLILLVSFILGVAVTVSEPDLQVLAQSVPHIDNMVLIVTVGVGVGFFLMVCMLRIFIGVKLRWLLIVFYVAVFVLAALADEVGIDGKLSGNTAEEVCAGFVGKVRNSGIDKRLLNHTRGGSLAVGARDDYRRHVLCQFAQQIGADFQCDPAREVGAASAKKPNKPTAQCACQHGSHYSNFHTESVYHQLL